MQIHVVDVDLDHVPLKSGVYAAIVGEDNQNVQYIERTADAKVTLVGRGSGEIDSQTGLPSQKPLQIIIRHSTATGLENAKSVLNMLLENVKEKFKHFEKPNVINCENCNLDILVELFKEHHQSCTRRWWPLGNNFIPWTPQKSDPPAEKVRSRPDSAWKSTVGDRKKETFLIDDDEADDKDDNLKKFLPEPPKTMHLGPQLPSTAELTEILQNAQKITSPHSGRSHQPSVHEMLGAHPTEAHLSSPNRHRAPSSSSDSHWGTSSHTGFNRVATRTSDWILGEEYHSPSPEAKKAKLSLAERPADGVAAAVQSLMEACKPLPPTSHNGRNVRVERPARDDLRWSETFQKLEELYQHQMSEAVRDELLRQVTGNIRIHPSQVRDAPAFCKMCQVKCVPNMNTHWSSHEHSQAYLRVQLNIGLKEFSRVFGQIPFYGMNTKGGRRLAVTAIDSFHTRLLPCGLDESELFREMVILIGKKCSFRCRACASIHTDMYNFADHVTTTEHIKACLDYLRNENMRGSGDASMVWPCPEQVMMLIKSGEIRDKMLGSSTSTSELSISKDVSMADGDSAEQFRGVVLGNFGLEALAGDLRTEAAKFINPGADEGQRFAAALKLNKKYGSVDIIMGALLGTPHLAACLAKIKRLSPHVVVMNCGFDELCSLDDSPYHVATEVYKFAKRLRQEFGVEMVIAMSTVNRQKGYKCMDRTFRHRVRSFNIELQKWMDGNPHIIFHSVKGFRHTNDKDGTHPTHIYATELMDPNIDTKSDVFIRYKREIRACLLEAVTGRSHPGPAEPGGVRDSPIGILDNTSQPAVTRKDSASVTPSVKHSDSFSFIIADDSHDSDDSDSSSEQPASQDLPLSSRKPSGSLERGYQVNNKEDGPHMLHTSGSVLVNDLSDWITSGSIEYYCPVCGQLTETFLDKQQLISHLDVHKNIFPTRASAEHYLDNYPVMVTTRSAIPEKLAEKYLPLSDENQATVRGRLADFVHYSRSQVLATAPDVAGGDSSRLQTACHWMHLPNISYYWCPFSDFLGADNMEDLECHILASHNDVFMNKELVRHYFYICPVIVTLRDPHREAAGVTSTDKQLAAPTVLVSSADNWEIVKKSFRSWRRSFSTCPVLSCADKYVYERPSDLAVHIREHHYIDVMKHIESIMCPVCRSNVPALRDLRQHLLNVHGDVFTSEKTIVNFYEKCPVLANIRNTSDGSLASQYSFPDIGAFMACIIPLINWSPQLLGSFRHSRDIASQKFLEWKQSSVI